jgi:preprotein translocase subunit YajC
MIGTAWAQAAGAPQGDAMMGMLPILIMFVILYFLMIRPQMKKSKEHKQMIEALQKGDEVVAIGFLGKISKVGPNYVALEIAENVVVQVEKAGVSRLLPKGTIKDAQ